MKRIPLLLAALGVVSAAAYAAPELTVTNFGQSIESENTSNGSHDVDDLWLWNTVGLKYNDWTFGLTAGKQWGVNFDDHKGNEKGMTSDDHRLQFDVSKPVTENLKLTGRYRGQKTYDRFQVGYAYNYGMLLSSGDFFYDSVNGNGHDTFHVEWFPVGVNLGPVQLKYYLEYVEDLSGREPGQRESYIDHQLRAYATLYKGERLTLSTEGRFTIVQDEDYNGQPLTKVGDEYQKGYRHFDDFGRIRLYLKANYALTENLDVYGTVGYGMRDYKLEDNDNGNGYKDDYTGKYWSNVVIGYNYKF